MSIFQDSFHFARFVAPHLWSLFLFQLDVAIPGFTAFFSLLGQHTAVRSSPLVIESHLNEGSYGIPLEFDW